MITKKSVLKAAKTRGLKMDPLMKLRVLAALLKGGNLSLQSVQQAERSARQLRQALAGTSVTAALEMLKAEQNLGKANQVFGKQPGVVGRLISQALSHIQQAASKL